MSEFNYIRNLLELKEVEVINVDVNSRVNLIHIKLPTTPHICPNCCNTTSKTHDYRFQYIKDIPINLKPTFLVYKKRRYICPSCNKKFYENNNFVGRYQHKSSRLNTTIIRELMSESSQTSVARRYNVSTSTVGRVIDYIPNTQLDELPQVIAIDEFKGDTNYGKYQCIITDPVDSKVLDILPVRNEIRLKEYFRKFSLEQRKGVKYAVIDMWRPYASVIKEMFPNVKLVIDRFHYVRQITWAMENVRKKIQKTLSKEDRLYFKNSKKLLLKNSLYISDEEYIRLRVMFRRSNKLEKAYDLKEIFYWVLQSKNSIEANERLDVWFRDIDEYKIPEFEYAAKTIRNWKRHILNSFDVPYTNAFTEGKNNKIKVLKRNGYGLRNFNRLKTRILLNNHHTKKGYHHIVTPFASTNFIGITPTFD